MEDEKREQCPECYGYGNDHCTNCPLYRACDRAQPWMGLTDDYQSSPEDFEA